MGVLLTEASDKLITEASDYLVTEAATLSADSGSFTITGTSAALTLAGGARYPGPAGKSKKKHKPQVVLTDGSVEPVEALQERQKPKPVRIEVEDFEAPAMPSLLGPFVPPEFRDWMPKTSSGRSYKSLVEEDDDEVLLLL